MAVIGHGQSLEQPEMKEFAKIGDFIPWKRPKIRKNPLKFYFF